MTFEHRAELIVDALMADIASWIDEYLSDKEIVEFRKKWTAIVINKLGSQ